MSAFFFWHFDTEIVIGDIGGTMGLCVGASVLSLFEFLDLLLLDRLFGGNNKVATNKENDSEESTIERKQTAETICPELYEDNNHDGDLSISDIPRVHWM